MNQDFLNYLMSVSSTGIGKEVDDSVNSFRKITCYMEQNLFQFWPISLCADKFHKY